MKRWSLRPFNSDDAGLLLDLDSDPEVMRFLSHGIPSTREQVEAALARILNLRRKFSDELGSWAAESQPSGEFIGWYILRPDKNDPDNTKKLEVGYRLKRKFWGQGLATEISQVLVERAFARPETEVVFAQAMKGNRGSIHVMEKLGLKFVREFDYTEIEARGVWFEITRAEWMTRRA